MMSAREFRQRGQHQILGRAVVHPIWCLRSVKIDADWIQGWILHPLIGRQWNCPLLISTADLFHRMVVIGHEYKKMKVIVQYTGLRSGGRGGCGRGVWREAGAAGEGGGGGRGGLNA